jgi:hypothetical protein
MHTRHAAAGPASGRGLWAASASAALPGACLIALPHDRAAGNDHDGEPLRFRAERILLARDLGMACFDVQHYLHSSADLQVRGLL